MAAPTATEPRSNPGILLEPPGPHPSFEKFPDISSHATWHVSSFKFGFGAECLRDGDSETFWHSDGPQPHCINVHFSKRTSVQKISLLLLFPLDDSYTPASFCVRAGTSLSDLQDVKYVSVNEPNNWITCDISNEMSEDNDGYKPLSLYVIQVMVLGNHLNGKDTHIRGMCVMGPIDDQSTTNDPFSFSQKFKMYDNIR